MEWTEVPARYENGKYIIHVDMPGSDIFGKEITDANGKKTLEFKAVVPEKDIILTQEDVNNLPSYYGMNAGDVFPSGAYEVEVKRQGHMLTWIIQMSRNQTRIPTLKKQF